MKKVFSLLIVVVLLVGCYDDDIVYNDKLPVRNITRIEESLSFHPNLQFDGGYDVFYGDNYGLLGAVLVVRVNQNNFLAYDLAAPHHTLEECSRPMKIDAETFPNVVSQCPQDGQDIVYNIYNPHLEVGGVTYSLRQYNAISDGKTVVITNF